MAALAMLPRRGPRAGAEGLLHLFRALSAATAGTTTGHGVLSVSDAMRRLRRESDPDRAVSIVEAIDTSSMSAGAARHTLSVAVRRLSRAGRPADAEALISSRLAASSTEPQLAAVLYSYASADLPEKALDAFRSAAPSLPTPISPLPFNALLSTFVRCHRHDRIPALFAELTREFSITPDTTSYTILVRAYCLTQDDAKAKQTLVQMRQQGISPTTKIYTALIQLMYNQKKTSEAELLWKEMVESGCKPDVAAFNVKAMNCRRLRGKPEQVMKAMAEMEAAGTKPDIIMYNFLISSYCRRGKLEEAKALYHSLAEKGCYANGATYRHMLAALCAKGDIDAGLGIFHESFRWNQVLTFRIMKGLVKGLVKAGRVAEAKNVIAKVKKRFPGNSLSEWKKLEKQLGLDSGSGDTDTPRLKGTSRESAAEAKSVAAERGI